MNRQTRIAQLIFLVFIVFGLSIASGVGPTAAQVSVPTGHGRWATGTTVTVTALRSGWANVTETFTSQDLTKTYGFSTIVISQRSQVSTGPSTTTTVTTTTTRTATLFVLRYDETPALSSVSPNTVGYCAPKPASPTTSLKIAPQACGGGGGGISYPQWEYTQAWSWGCWCYVYVQSDPINFGYQYKSVNDISNYLQSHGWYDTWWCSNSEYIYDYTGYGWKGYDKTLAVDSPLTTGGNSNSGWGCTSGQRVHDRLFVMASGQIAVGAHHEYFNGFGHTVDSFEGGEITVANYENGQCQYSLNGYNGCTAFCGSYTCAAQYNVQPDYLYLNNYISYPYNDGYATLAF